MTPDAAVRCRCRLGENPLWDERQGAIYWTHLPAGQIHRYVPATGVHSRILLGAP